MFKAFHKTEMQESFENCELTRLCTMCMENSHDIAFHELIRECGTIGNHSLWFNFYIPPALGKLARSRYDGIGAVDIDRTVQEICIHGRQLGSVISRTHQKEKQRTNLAVLIDNSAQMTAQWISKKLDEEIHPEDSPQILIKIAAISILESLGRKADATDIIIFGEDVEGPFNLSQLSYKELLQQTGSGLSRLDLGLAKVLQMEWEMRPGSRLLFILGGGLPYMGRNILIDDIEVQINVLYYLKRMMGHGVKVVYFPFFTHMGHLDERVGAFSPRSFAKKIRQAGASVAEINSELSLPHGLRNGLINMMKGPAIEMPVFEEA